MNKSKINVIGIIISALILFIPVGYIIYCKMNEYILPGKIMFTFILPFLLAVATVFIKKIPDVIKLIVPIVIFSMSLFGMYWLNGVGGHTIFKSFDGEGEINEYYGEFDFSDFGSYDKISNYYYLSTGIFQQKANTTIAKYNDIDFIEQIEYIENEYDFYSEPISDNEPVPVFNFDGFEFRVEKSKSPEFWYPKQLYLIGINNKSKEIAYVNFEDADLDRVSDFNYIFDYFGWLYISSDRNS